MKGTDISWPDFEDAIRDVRQTVGNEASLLFRGQADSSWQLVTTLERAGCEGLAVANYLHLTSRVKPAIETFTGRSWDDADYRPSVTKDLEKFDAFHAFPSESVYRYMIYLRHHGFPSPLLDWSYSPYVAAFFAFRDMRPSHSKRSVYVYCERPEGYKTYGSDRPYIRCIGPYARSHPRHFRQQSDYTICGKFLPPIGWSFHPHEAVFETRRIGQDFLWRFDLPSTEREAVLRQLDKYNLTAFSLFDSDEALLETMWFREHVARGKE